MDPIKKTSSLVLKLWFPNLSQEALYYAMVLL